jgi:dihydrofolate synthase/folylpolyglutamate synthase
MGRYQEALDYIFSYVNYERQARYSYNAVTFNLRRMEELLDKLGRPQDKFACVHIAGTKGKGSTSAMVESVLRAAGYRTGLYTSPHLHTFRERIRVSGELISKAELVDVLAHSKSAIEAVPGITAFEVMTALGFLYFAEKGVEWAVLEVGLGGRLDATNVVRPAVCGITSLSYDHTELLGHTLSLIAWEKAGIAKAGVPLVSAPQEPEAMGVIEQVCADIGARLVRVGQEWTFEASRVAREDREPHPGEVSHSSDNRGCTPDLSGQSLTVRRVTDSLVLPDLRIRLLGRHQLVNATTAVAILAELNTQGVMITETAVRTGLAEARWPGRFEVLHRHPDLVVDSAHNADSAHKLKAALTEWFPESHVSGVPAGFRGAGPYGTSAPTHRRLALVFGASADKDISGMLETFLHPQGDDPQLSTADAEDPLQRMDCLPGNRPLAVDKVIVTRSGHPRSADPNALLEQVRAVGFPADGALSTSENLESALADVLAWATGSDDLICITGSIFVVAQARRVWAELHPEAFPADDWVHQDETGGKVVGDDELNFPVVEDPLQRAGGPPEA